MHAAIRAAMHAAIRAAMHAAIRTAIRAAMHAAIRAATAKHTVTPLLGSASPLAEAPPVAAS